MPLRVEPSNRASHPANATAAHRRVQLAIKGALGDDYQVDWLGPSSAKGLHILLLKHAGSQRAAALLFDDIDPCERLSLKDYAAAISAADTCVAEIAAAAYELSPAFRNLVQPCFAQIGRRHADADATIRIEIKKERFGQCGDPRRIGDFGD